VDNGRVRWLTVDLPETVALRWRLLPESPRQRLIACSALDERWMDGVDQARGVLITAQGLLMYLQPAEVHGLIAACAERFAGHAMLFDAVPRWFSARTVRGEMKTEQGYQTPPMPWAMDAGELRTLRGLHPNIRSVRELRPPRGRGPLFGSVMPLLYRIPAVRRLLLSVLLARFGPTSDAAPG
jgi:O-methyltransferase involved in polyketide biosynthesis